MTTRLAQVEKIVMETEEKLKTITYWKWKITTKAGAYTKIKKLLFDESELQ